MKRIRVMSQIIKALFLIYVFAAGLIAVLFHASATIFGIPISKIAELPAGMELLLALGISISLLAAVTFYQLLNLYEQGTVFSLANVRLYKRLGWLAIGYGLFKACGPGFGLDFVTHLKFFLFTAAFSPWTICGLFVVLISLVMTEACKLREEQDLTV